ncbi:MAG: hypothetical protein EB084_13920 [Proteobacteria bacterium]|nr:hypothetical protein [Pseudomonadota bacterium]
MAQGTSAQGEARNPILDAIMEVVNNGKDANILRPVLERANTELASLRAEISETVQGLQPPVREACAPQIQAVGQAVTLYEGGLTTVEQHFTDKQTYTLVRGGELIRRASFLLNDGLFNLRNQALVAMGPSDIPDYNFIHQLYERVRSGEIERDGNFHSAVDRARRLAEIAHQQASQQKPSAERDLLLASYKRNADACGMLLDFVKEGRAELLEKGMEDLRASFTEIRDLIPQIQMRMRTQGPTQSPMANFVINMAVEYASGSIPEQYLRDALDQLKGNFENLRRQFEATARGHIESVLIQEEAARVRTALELEEQALDTYYRFFETREGFLLGTASKQLVEAMQRLDEAQKAFAELADREGKILCVRCSAYNERDRRTCEKCGARLLQPAETGVMSTLEFSEQMSSARSGEEDIPVGENIQRIFKAVNEVAEGHISLEQFEAELNWLEEVVERHAATVGAQPEVKSDAVPADQREQLAGIASLNEQIDAQFKEAVEYFRQGLSRYRCYVDDQEKNHLIEGTRSVWEANKRLHSVQMLSARVRDEAASPASAPEEES